MTIKATKKFSKLGSANNWAGFGKTLFQKLESGESIDFNAPSELIEDGYLEIVTKSKPKKDKE